MQRNSPEKPLYIGIMSGTSLDGVDVALCQIDSESCELLAFLEYPLPQPLKSDILLAIDGVCSLATVGELEHRLGVLFSDAVNALLERESIPPDTIEAIGSHGQTLWHEPKGEHPFSMQLGDPNTITARTGIKVVADFRRKDIALGGHGAPFAPAFHQFLFAERVERIAIVNIGGVANLTIVGEKLVGYDTGCGNVLLDAWMQKHQGKSYDKDGAWASQGKVNRELLHKMLKEPFFSQKAPKSTGREKFNLGWVEKKIEGLSVKAIDVQATLLELTAQTIADEVRLYKRELVLLCGGGAKNIALVEKIRELSNSDDGILPPCKIDTTDSCGVSADYMEAMAFAWLAYKRIHREVVELKDVTGARENGVLGGIYE